jgi:hypothetical protein
MTNLNGNQKDFFLSQFVGAGDLFLQPSLLSVPWSVPLLVLTVKPYLGIILSPPTGAATLQDWPAGQRDEYS